MNHKSKTTIENKLSPNEEILTRQELNEIVTLKEKIESWKHPRTNLDGEIEYHTSYGWFTEEQITYIQNSNINDYL